LTLLVGRQEGHPACKNKLVGCWCCLSGARCRLAYGPADATATHLSLASVKSRLVLPFWYRLTRAVPEKGPLNGCVCVGLQRRDRNGDLRPMSRLRFYRARYFYARVRYSIRYDTRRYLNVRPKADTSQLKKGKVFPYSLPSVWPGADPGVQAVSPQVT